MRIPLVNRITISLVVIVLLTAGWEFFVKPESSPLYTAAVAEYKGQNYPGSLQLLQRAYRIDANDTAILTLMGWDFLKMGNPRAAEPNFRRAHQLAPRVIDTLLGYIETEIALQKYDDAGALFKELRQLGGDSADVHVAAGTLDRQLGRNVEAVHEFQLALERDKNNTLAQKNIKEIYNITGGDLKQAGLQLPKLVKEAKLTYPAKVEGDFFSWRIGDAWRPVYLAGVDLTPSLPGHFSTDSSLDMALYSDWFQKISDVGANTIRIYSILPPAFYRALFQFNTANPQRPLWILQGIPLDDPPGNDLFDHKYYETARQEISDTLDVIHGQGDIRAIPSHPGGIFPNDVSGWVVGFLIGQTWLSHVVTGNNQLHPEMQNWRGTYIEVPSGSPTEIFLGQMINYAQEYEEGKYNWQHPAAFPNWPPLDPIRHATESTMLEEVSIRHSLGERFPTPPGPYDDDDGVSLDPTHLKPTSRFAAGYFSAYSVFPFYPDFINLDPRYQEARDAGGSNPFLGYLEDLKSHTRGIPLVITEFGIPSSFGIGHFSPAGFNQGGKTEEQQGELLARFSYNIHDAGAAGGLVFEWIDQWFRQSWLLRNYEIPQDRRALWQNAMEPSESFGLLGADPHDRQAHRLEGDPAEWQSVAPLYTSSQDRPFQPAGDRYDPGRKLKALYADSDEAFLYLHLVVAKLDNDNDGLPDWNNVNYLVGLGTSPAHAGLTYLPFIAPVQFSRGMTYAIQLAGPEDSHIFIASSYNPFQIVSVEGIPSQTTMVPKLGWKPKVTDSGSFEAQVIEPNRRRFGRDGKYYASQRYDRGILRYGSLEPRSPEYDTLAEWHANVQTNSIDLRIPWNLLNVTDPSSLQVLAGMERDGTVDALTTPGISIAAFSYRPLEAARLRPIMEQGHPIADALPELSGPATLNPSAMKTYRWIGWDSVKFDPKTQLRLKDSYPVLRKAFVSVIALPPGSHSPSLRIAGVRNATRNGRETAGKPPNPGR